MADTDKTFGDGSVSASCYCGAVKVLVSGPPAQSGICHCQSCQAWHAAPVNAFSIWPAGLIDIQGNICTAEISADSHRVSCARCGGAIANKKPKINMTVVYATLHQKAGIPFEPEFHIFYQERAVDIADGLPKFADLPKELGGSGHMIEEPATTNWMISGA